jgi:DNA-binding MarR family transcriptional regulator
MKQHVSTPLANHLDFGILLGLAYQSFVEELQTHMRARGFSDMGPSFGYVLRAVAAEPLTATQLGARLHLTPQGAAKIVDDMVRRGYLERRADPEDGRARLLVLATRGQLALRTARAFHRAFERRFARSYGADAAEAVRAALEALLSGGGASGRRDTAAAVLRPL